jgi:hypothetical protein
MEPTKEPPSRKKFLLLTAAAFCSATILRLLTRKKKDRLYTVKMLTQDGKLVEVDRKWLGPPQKKVSNRELQEWVKNNPEKNKN